MDARSTRVSAKTQSGCSLEDQLLRKRNLRDNCDRFIPNRSAMDFDYAHYMLTAPRKPRENPASSSPSSKAYQQLLSDTFNMNRGRILAFKNKLSIQVEPIPGDTFSSLPRTSSNKPHRCIPQHPSLIIDAPDLLNDFYLNLMDWGSNNVIAIGLENTVHFWNDSNRSISELLTVDDDIGPVTSVSWAPDGRHIAVGFNNSEVQLWDSIAKRKVRRFKSGHSHRVGSLAWNDHILTTGGLDGLVINNDVRVRSHIVETYDGHYTEVCGLKWSASGRQLASGGTDELLYIWDRSMASRNSSTQWLHRLDSHTSTVKALAWCPFRGDLLASGGGFSDGTIKFWSTHTGACISSVDTGSQISALLWNKNEREILSSHGYMENKLTLWKYPSMVKMADLTGHAGRVLLMAQSPDGCKVASAAGDETIRFWDVFGTLKSAKNVQKAYSEPFSRFSSIR